MSHTIEKELLIQLYTTMYKIRKFEEAGVKLYRQGEIRGYFHPYWGEEAIATGVCAALGADDYITSTHRGHGHCVAWGADLNRMFAELLGKKTGYCQGLGGSMHIADYSMGNLGANGVVSSGVPIATGAALGIKIRNGNQVVACFTSDGGSNNGSFLEGLNLAAAWKLPVIFVIENNQFAVSTPIEASTGETELYRRGIGFGVESIRIDGNDVTQVYGTARGFMERCRSKEGPFLMECLTFRKSGHHVNDPGAYLPEEKVAYYARHDPLVIGKKKMEELGLSENEITEMEEKVNQEIKEAVKYGISSPELSAVEFIQMVEDY
jgi:acetoin:2,6-dichlorophenolindophenol oxidoreductase subunit alpha